jgi:type VI secretion system secreted protein Hcp
MAMDIYLQLKGIDGDSTDGKHSNWIEITSLQWSVSHTEHGGSVSGQSSGAAGRADIQDITITKVLDKSSPNFLKYCVAGTHISDGKIEFCAATGQKQVYLTYTLKNVYVTSFQTTSSAAGDQNKPTETISFSFSQYKVEHTAWKSDGSKGGTTSAGWDLTKNSEP